MANDRKIEADHEKASDASEAEKSRLLKQMDITMVQKLAFASAHFQLHDGARILDIGCARGKGSYHLAALNPRLEVVGLDYDQSYIDEANETYKLPNLSFICRDIRNLEDDGEQYDAILNSSVMHEIYSFSDYNMNALNEAMEGQLKLLKPGGVILLRDFMKPPVSDAMVYLDLPPGESKSDKPEDLSYPDLLRLYAKVADRMKSEELQGFFCEHVGTTEDGWERFYLPHEWAFEFIWRKEYRQRFDVESREKYSVWSAKQYRDVPESFGARVVYTAPYYNPWIVKNWHKDKYRLFDQNMNPLQGPPSNYIALIKKTEEGRALGLAEHRSADKEPSYLKLEHFENAGNGELYDLVSRPGDVYDIIPYGRNDQGHIVVYAKSGYPRPIVNIHARQMTPNLDGKSWSGHMVEPLAIANQQDTSAHAVASVLQERAGFDPDKVGKMTEALTYYTAPADVNERVSSVFVEMKSAPYEKRLSGSFSNFSSDGTVRAFEIQDILRGIQVGMLAEARLEMNIYALMRAMAATPEQWIGDTYDIAESDGVTTKSVKEVLTGAEKVEYRKTDKPAHCLKTLRSIFVEKAVEKGASKTLMSQELEFAVPDKGINGEQISTNSAMAVPLLKDKKTGEILIGTEVRHFPSLQEQEGDSRILTIPGFRLPSGIKNLEGVKPYLADKLGVGNSEAIQQIGEGYFPSMGILPNRVFPYVVSDPALAQNKGLYFVGLRELFENMDKLNDAHLILAVSRTVHALGLWDDYTRNFKPENKAQLTLDG